MADRLAKMFSSPKFKESKTYVSNNLKGNVSPLLSSSRNNSTQDELSLELDARSDGFTTRICDTANSLLLGEFPWGSDRQCDYHTIKQIRQPKPVPVRVRIGPPNSSSLLLCENDGSEYDNEEYNSSKSLIQALREMSRKRTHSLMNEESDNEIDGRVAPKKSCKPVEYRHNLYLSQLEEDTQEYKSSVNSQSDQFLERGKRGREEDSIKTSTMMLGISSPDVGQSKRQRRSGDAGIRPPEERISGAISCNGTNGVMATTNGVVLQSNRVPRRGSNEIISSLSSSLTLLDPAVLYRLIRPRVQKNRRKTLKKVVAAETQTIEPIPEENIEIKEQANSPKKEDKSINTEPEKTVRAVVEERQVTDKMANALMKSAVSKFLATEDPTLSPVRSPLPPISSAVEKATPPPTSNIAKELTLPVLAATTSVVLTSSNDLLPTSTRPPPTDDKQTNNTFTFGAPLNTAQNTIVPTSSFTLGSPSSTVTTTSTTSNLFTMPASTETVSTSKPTNSVKHVSFGENKLDSGFKLPETTNEKNKPEETIKTELFKQPNLSANSVATTPSTQSEPNKGTFSFGFNTPSSTSATNSEPLKTSTFTFGSGNITSGEFSAKPSFSSTEDSTKNMNEPPKMTLFNTPTTAKSSEPKQIGTGSTGGFQFGNNSSEKKNYKPEEKKSPGLFGFGAVASTPATKAETKPFAFGTSTSASSSTAEVTQAPLQQSKPIFQFGSSSFSTPSASKEGFSFGSKPSSEQPAVASSFASPSSLFGTKPAASSTSTTAATTTSTTTPGLFGFGTVQSSAATTMAPVFGTSTTTANNSVGSFSFQPNKPEEKPATGGGFSFKFSGTSASSAEPPKPSFSFGASNSQTPAPTFGASSMTTQPTFGNVTPTASNFSAFSNPAAKPTFGTASSAPAPTFGANTTASSATTPAFGSSTSASSTSAPVFGASSAAAAAPAPAFGANPAVSSTPTPAFGANPAVSSIPTPAFGANPAGSSTPVPAFGASSATSSSSAPAFGATSAGSSTTSAPSFGASASAPAPAFGSTTTSTHVFGAPNQPTPQLFGAMQTQQTPGPSFSFGASSAVPNPSAGFNFNAPTQTSAQPASTGLFQFGSSTNQQNPVGGVQPFQFNATPASTSQVGGGQPMFSIGSGSTAPRSRYGIYFLGSFRSL
uniref:Uncharacterized protein n=1 Tax=Rhodnius prolixus TaxID=13249 RepID=T1HVA3_RHOPR